ncbi:amidase [Paenibacillus sp. JX-17]|uniref:Amidase n=1 Tax=Paenibacillus lacisoli TaxID=3064525 RepID=A0ABT9CD21_9BACL|nr:amidase [Paenibacillus sp. JX-17]MDO7905576.1 amidase [Paenibacillus sp. JX-17]
MQPDYSTIVSPKNIEPTGNGVLNGISFAVKDVFAVEGHTNGAGNPTWLRTHAPAASHSSSIFKLLSNGACLTAMTATDELMFSLAGENVHYGTPVNPKAPDRIPGGSSSGSAAAVAAGLAGVALGTDTGGSVRVPSSYCGLYGMRPTWGKIPLDGVIPLAASFDTVGWMAPTLELLKQTGFLLLDSAEVNRETTWSWKLAFLPEEAWELCDPLAAAALREALTGCKSSLPVRLESVSLPLEGEALQDWAGVFRMVQGYEIWQEHGAWIEREKPVFGSDIGERIRWTQTITQEQYEEHTARRQSIRTRLIEMLGSDSMLVIPTVPGPAPLRGYTGPRADQIRQHTMQLTCIAGLGGLPQVTLPLAESEGCPVGLSFIAGPGQDLRLLSWLETHFRVLQNN